MSKIVFDFKPIDVDFNPKKEYPYMATYRLVNDKGENIINLNGALGEIVVADKEVPEYNKEKKSLLSTIVIMALFHPELIELSENIKTKVDELRHYITPENYHEFMDDIYNKFKSDIKVNILE